MFPTRERKSWRSKETDLERVLWRDGTGAVTGHDLRHVFLMTGADASTAWLNGRVNLDAKGFIKTGPDLTREDLAAVQWPLERSPYCSKPHFLACSRWATFDAATSNASHRPWMKDRSQFRLSIACWPSSRGRIWPLPCGTVAIRPHRAVAKPRATSCEFGFAKWERGCGLIRRYRRYLRLIDRQSRVWFHAFEGGQHDTSYRDRTTHRADY
jgi:hypothetical protein